MKVRFSISFIIATLILLTLLNYPSIINNNGVYQDVDNINSELDLYIENNSSDNHLRLNDLPYPDSNQYEWFYTLDEDEDGVDDTAHIFKKSVSCYLSDEYLSLTFVVMFYNISTNSWVEIYREDKNDVHHFDYDPTWGADCPEYVSFFEFQATDAGSYSFEIYEVFSSSPDRTGAISTGYTSKLWWDNADAYGPAILFVEANANTIDSNTVSIDYNTTYEIDLPSNLKFEIAVWYANNTLNQWVYVETFLVSPVSISGVGIHVDSFEYSAPGIGYYGFQIKGILESQTRTITSEILFLYWESGGVEDFFSGTAYYDTYDKDSDDVDDTTVTYIDVDYTVKTTANLIVQVTIWQWDYNSNSWIYTETLPVVDLVLSGTGNLNTSVEWSARETGSYSLTVVLTWSSATLNTDEFIYLTWDAKDAYFSETFDYNYYLAYDDMDGDSFNDTVSFSVDLIYELYGSGVIKIFVIVWEWDLENSVWIDRGEIYNSTTDVLDNGTLTKSFQWKSNIDGRISFDLVIDITTPNGRSFNREFSYVTIDRFTSDYYALDYGNVSYLDMSLDGSNDTIVINGQLGYNIDGTSQINIEVLAMKWNVITSSYVLVEIFYNLTSTLEGQGILDLDLLYNIPEDGDWLIEIRYEIVKNSVSDRSTYLIFWKGATIYREPIIISTTITNEITSTVTSEVVNTISVTSEVVSTISVTNEVISTTTIATTETKTSDTPISILPIISVLIFIVFVRHRHSTKSIRRKKSLFELCTRD